MSAYEVKWFKHDMPGAPVLTGEPGMLIGLLDACLLNGWGLVSVDTLTFDSNTGEATLTVTGGHGFIVDQVILISGANEAEFNGEQRVIWADSTTIKFNPVHIPQVATASGSITAKVAPQGSWGKPFSSGDNLKAVYQSISPARMSTVAIRIDDSNTQTADPDWDYNGAHSIAQAYEVVNDLDSVTGLINTEPYRQVIRKSSDTSSNYIANPVKWTIVADGRMVYLFINHYSRVVDNFYSPYCFGEFVSYKAADEFAWMFSTVRQTSQSYQGASDFCVLGNNNDSNRSFYFQRSYSGVAGSVKGIPVGLFLNQPYMGKQSSVFPFAADNGLHYADRVHLAEGVSSSTQMRGELPGIGYPLHKVPLLSESIETLNWKGKNSKVIALTCCRMSYVNSDDIAQVLVDIEGPWRA